MSTKEEIERLSMACTPRKEKRRKDYVFSLFVIFLIFSTTQYGLFQVNANKLEDINECRKVQSNALQKRYEWMLSVENRLHALGFPGPPISKETLIP